MKIYDIHVDKEPLRLSQNMCKIATFSFRVSARHSEPSEDL